MPRVDAGVGVKHDHPMVAVAIGDVDKYRLALVVAGERALRYDNESGKGDHRHVGDVERAYSFSSYETLLSDFWRDVDAWRQTR